MGRVWGMGKDSFLLGRTVENCVFRRVKIFYCISRRNYFMRRINIWGSLFIWEERESW